MKPESNLKPLRPRRGLSLANQMAILICVCTSPILVLAVIGLGSVSSSSLRQAAERELAADAQANAHSVEQWDDAFVKALRLARGEPNVVSMDPARQRPILLGLQRTYADLDIVRTTGLDGWSVARTDGRNAVNYSDREWFSSCVDGVDVDRQTLITRTTHNAVLNISMPIRDGRGKIVGVLSALTKLTSMAKVLGLNTSFTTIVVDEEGKALAHPDAGKAAKLYDLSGYPPVRAALAGRPGAMSFTDANGVEWLSQSVNIKNGWLVVSAVEAAKIEAPGARMMRLAWCFVALALLVIAITTWWITRRMAGPIRELTTGAMALASGDWDRRVPQKGRGELATLGAAFNEMATRLQDVYAQIEAKVQERTAELRSAERELRKLSRVVEQTPASVIITDMAGAIEYVNPAFTQITGYAPQEVIGKNPRILKSGTMPAETYTQLWAELTAGREWRGEMHNRRKDGSLFWELGVISPLKDADGRVTHYLSVKGNITARKEMEEELRAAARTDKLTGLPNRALFSDRLQQAVARSRRRKDYRFAVLFIDFDRFKSINDSLGHDAGDTFLKEIAARLQATVRSVDSLSHFAPEHTEARLGGDEFVVLLDAIAKPQDATLVADRLLEAFSRPYQVGGTQVYSTASIGVVTSDISDESADAVLRDADIAMYEAKLAGKSRYVVFDHKMRQRVANQLNLESDLRQAFDNGELFLTYQPIVDLETGRMRGVESLLRWQHPARGLISPTEFIPVAEEVGLIVPIGRWVLGEACRQLAAWRREGKGPVPEYVSVNLSRKQLASPELAEVVSTTLAEHGLEAPSLQLEITESIVMRDAQTSLQTLRALKEIGVRLALDDFGTGYSSLSCLHQFPVDVLKVDRSFVANIERGRDFAALVQAIVALAHSLGVTVVAEGVETVEQVVMLQSYECQFAQGYLFSKPLRADAVAGFGAAPTALAVSAALANPASL